MSKKKNVKRAEPTIPETLNTPEFTAAWAEWLRFTEERGMPLADDDAVRQLKLLAKVGPEAAYRRHSKDHAGASAQGPRPGPGRGRKEGQEQREGGEEEPAEDTAKKDSTPAKTAKEKKAKAPKEPKEKKMSALDAAAKVLEEKGEPMTCPEMIEAMSAKRVLVVAGWSDACRHSLFGNTYGRPARRGARPASRKQLCGRLHNCLYVAYALMWRPLKAC